MEMTKADPKTDVARVGSRLATAVIKRPLRSAYGFKLGLGRSVSYVSEIGLSARQER
jgi:hypothetical protein